MARSKAQPYLDKLAFIIDRRRVFDVADYDAPFSEWSRQMKARLTEEYNRANLATATDEIADQRDYKTMAKLVRPFAKAFKASEGYRLDDIDNWTPAKKRKLTKYYKKAIMLASKQFEMYHSNDDESMAKMRELSNQKGYPEFNQVFYPAPAGSSIHFDKKTGSAKAVGLRSTSTRFYWDQFGITSEELAADPVAVVKAVIAQTGNGKRRFSINAGEHSIGKGVPLLYTQNAAANAVKRLVEKYGADKEDPEDPNSHYFGNWLDGLEAWDFDTRQDEQRFIRSTMEESIERKRYKRALRKRLQRKATKRGKKR